MPVGKFHGQVAVIALRAAAPHGFALGGGNALIAHGIIERGQRGSRCCCRWPTLTGPASR